ncbi:MAG: BsuBI/PstI family type II restriction endonuclease [Candidatus Levyibacteriota bacterium]
MDTLPLITHILYYPSVPVYPTIAYDPKIPLTLPQGLELTLTQGKHNDLQKAIIEGFLPIYGYNSDVLYVGDTANKLLYLDEERLKALNFFELNHDELPDVITYSQEKNWLYLIEAVHSSGPISPSRLVELKRLTKDCAAEIVYVTAFLDRETFRKYIADIAWETEVWIADNPEHLVHFNGHKFLGPYKK